MPPMDLTAKVTVLATVTLIVGGWGLFTWFEWTNPATLGALPGDQSIVNGLFHSITPRTAGFNSVDMAALGEPARLLTEILMFIGGAPAFACNRARRQFSSARTWSRM